MRRQRNAALEAMAAAIEAASAELFAANAEDLSWRRHAGDEKRFGCDDGAAEAE